LGVVDTETLAGAGVSVDNARRRHLFALLSLQKEVSMAKYLVQASYTSEGVKGLLKDGGSKRRAAIEEAVSRLGGRLEGFYFAFGETDVFVVVDGLDNTAAAAVALAVGSTGAVRQRTHVLLSPEEVDEACKKTVSYRAPGA
jgi:uncharacterized protein with GYD domain